MPDMNKFHQERRICMSAGNISLIMIIGLVVIFIIAAVVVIAAIVIGIIIAVKSANKSSNTIESNSVSKQE